MELNSLLYLHFDTLASKEIKSDVDFLVDLIKSDAEKHSHASVLEHLAFKESLIEGLEEEKILMLMWTARFHGLGEAEHVRENIHNKLESTYAKDMLEKVILISLERKNFPEDSFDYVGFFDSLQNRAHLKKAMDLQGPVSNISGHVEALGEHGKKYRSARIFLQKHERTINNLEIGN